MRELRWFAVMALALLALPLTAGAQERGAVSGQVTDAATRAPIQGAQVLVAGTTIGTLTNQQGQFTLPSVPTGTRTVQISRTGYKPASRTVTVGATPAQVSVELQADVIGLEELVVVGYGVERRRNVTGAVSTIRASETVAQLPAPTVDNVLQGRVSGVQVTQNSGTPGAAISVRVRGASSVTAGNQPLYVVDGVPMVQGNFSSIDDEFGGQGIDALADLNPSEIESIQVLKDASAAAIYGSRASNGVVLITTKRGRANQRPEITWNSFYGTQSLWRKPGFLNAEEYIQVTNEGIQNYFGDPTWFYVGYEDDDVENDIELPYRADTNWIDEVTRDASIYNLSGSIAGGSERTRYFVSGTSFMQDGTVIGTGYERLSGRVNLDYTATDRLTLGTNVSLSRAVTDRQRGDNTIYGPFANAAASAPVDSVYLGGEYNLGTIAYDNPVALGRENQGQERSIRILGNGFANFNLLEGLDARFSVGLDQYNLRSRLYDSPIVGPASGSQGAGEFGDAYVNKVIYEGTLNFSRDFGSRHAVSGVVGTSYEDNTEERNSVTGTKFPSSYFRYLTSAATITTGTSSLTEWTLLSGFGRLSYTFDDRITTTFNIRSDGSSRFGENNRYGLFPSASVLWRLSDEPFLEAQEVVSDLALRVSYGRTGNQQGIGNQAWRALVGSGFNWEDEPGLAPVQLANPDLSWEKTDQFNVGTDVAFLDDRLGFSLDYYNKKTTDLLLDRPIPTTTGFRILTSNIGAMKNTGFEVSSRVHWLRGESQGLDWTTEFNVSTNRNEVTALYNNEPLNFGFASRVEVGQPLGVFYGWKTAGIFRTQEEVEEWAFQSDETAAGDVKFQDINGRDANGELTGQPDGIVNDDDRTIIGDPWPDYVGGVTNTLSYRGLDLSVFMQFSQGNDIYNANRIYWDAYGYGGFDNFSSRARDRWTPENPTASEPRAVLFDPNENTRDSERFIEDGSYVRLKNVVLGYTLPRQWATRLGARSLRLYVQGQNLKTWTDYSGFDPEVNYAGDTDVTRGTDFYTTPQARSVTFGINLGL